MRVDPRFLPSPAGPSSAARPAAGGAVFALGTPAQAAAGARPAAGAAVPSSALATADALVALQGGGVGGEERERRRRSARGGHALLDSLDRLKAALLVGRVATADLKAIAARLAERAELSGDPRLDELLGHIRLRAEVELAKLAVAEGRSV